MIKNYIISSAGRSGCHLLVALIRSCGKKADHTHDPFFQPNKTNGRETALILLQRRDLFSAIMSMLVGVKTQQWSSYPNKVIPPFRVKRLEFEHQYTWQKNYIQSCKAIKNYRQVKLLDFEDVVNDFNYVFQQLEITQLHPPALPEKSPYSYRDIIENWGKCRSIFDQLESNYKFAPILKQDIIHMKRHH
jgi:LPS sulfotransferase NodH